MALLQINGISASALVPLPPLPLPYGVPAAHPYCSFRVGTKEARTAVRFRAPDADWDDMLTLELPPHLATRLLEVTVFDFNGTPAPAPLGTFTVPLPEGPRTAQVTCPLVTHRKQFRAATGTLVFTYSIMSYWATKPGGPSAEAPPSGRYVFTGLERALAPVGSDVLLPGAVQFLHELRGDMDDSVTSQRAPKVTVLLASGRESAPWLATQLTLQGRSIHGPTLCGRAVQTEVDQPPATAAVMGQRKERALEKWKLEKWNRRWALPVVYVGDTYETDVVAVEGMLRKGLADFAFLRRSSELQLPLGDRLRANVIVFDHFAQAATLACDAALLTPAARDRVLEAASQPPPPAPGDGGKPSSAPDRTPVKK